MATLVSPGVAVTVTDESFYGSAGAGTVPMIVVATQQDRLHVSGSGIAAGTTQAKAGIPQLVTSQFELAQTFGNPFFQKNGANSVHGGELNEYGLLAAHSFLGAANRAYVVRADINTEQLIANATEPKGDPVDGTYWLDTASTVWGIFEHDGTDWVEQTVTVYTSTPGPTDGSNGDYAVDVSTTANQFYKKIAGSWVMVETTAIQAATGGSEVVTVSEHYNLPASQNLGDIWFKTTTPNFGFNPSLKVWSAAANQWQGVVGTVSIAQPANPAVGDIWFDLTASDAKFTPRRWDGTTFNVLSYQASATAPTGPTPNGTLWFDATLYYDIYVKGTNAWNAVSGDVQLSTSAPTTQSNGINALQPGDIWVDTNEDDFTIYTYNGASWVLRDTTDQTTPNGVVFGDLHPGNFSTTPPTANTGVTLAGAPDPLLFPDGILLINLAASGNNVKQYDSANGYWLTASSNQPDGRGSFGRRAQRKVIVNAMQAALSGNTDLRQETVTFNLIAAPGYPELADEMNTLNIDRKETAFIVVDTPFRLTPNEAVSWATALADADGENGLTTKNFNIGVYYPHAVTTNVDGQTVLAPASHIALRTIAYNDQVSFPWFAPAGLTRGVVNNASSVGYLTSESEIKTVALSNGQRDALYLNKVNPIANFPNDGLIVWGQKTMNAAESALDRVNVSRLVSYLRERFDSLARPFIFEQNDEFTRANAKRAFERFIGDIMAKRGVYDFAVVCDETNNTPARIDRNELYIDVAIEPTKAAEFIYVPIRILNTGAIQSL